MTRAAPPHPTAACSQEVLLNETPDLVKVLKVVCVYQQACLSFLEERPELHAG